MLKSDWQSSIKPIAKNLYAELSKTHGKETGAMVEALEIARRQAEVDATRRVWQERHGLGKRGETMLLLAGEIFGQLCGEFGAQRAVHILTGLEREQNRAKWGNEMRAWRGKFGYTVAEAAGELGLAVEDVEAIEFGDFSAGPEVMRLVRPALRRVRGELGFTDAT